MQAPAHDFYSTEEKLAGFEQVEVFVDLTDWIDWKAEAIVLDFERKY